MRPLVACLAAVLSLACGALAAAPPDDPSAGRRIHLRIGTFDPRETRPDLPERLRLRDEPAGGYFLVQLEGRADRRTAVRLRARGAEPLAYVPDGAYVVRVAAGRVADLRSLAGVRWLGPIEPGYKLAPDIGRRAFVDGARRDGGRLPVTVDLFRGEDLGDAARRITATGATVLHQAGFGDTLRLAVRGTIEQLEAVARIPGVSWIDEAGEATPRNGSATWVVQTNVLGETDVWSHGLHGENQIIGIIDWPIDINSCFFLDPIDNTPGPGHRKIVAYRSAFGLGADYHGTHVGGIAAGSSQPVNGSLASAGHAYAAKLSYSDVNDITGLDPPDPSNLYSYFAAAHADGARVHTNSWGDDSTTAYTAWSRDIDLFSHDFEDDLVLFAVTNTSTLKTPENAKNVLAVAATNNGTSAGTFCRGGAGPTSDGRRKPEILAPGCGIVSARYLAGCDVWSISGTSMAAPAVAGAAALARQYFVEGWYPTGSKQPSDSRVPSGALLKAVLINSAVNLTSELGFPGNREGWGRVLLENGLFFGGDSRRLVVLGDVRNASGLGTAEQDAFVLQVTSAAEPLEITLAYTDPPAALMAAAATVNDLDLEAISPSGLLYRGNAFDPVLEHSTLVGPVDPRNNVETILLPSPEIGTWVVSVRGTAVQVGTQGYAVVATGSVEASTASGTVRHAGHRVDDPGPLGDGDGSPEPGETVRVPLSLLNLRTTTAASLSAKLFSQDLALASVTAGSASYVDLPAQQVGESLAPHFDIAISPVATCGQAIPMNVRATHVGGTDDSSFQFVVGDPTVGGDDPCSPLSCPGDPLPADVGSTLAVMRAGAADVALAWNAVAGADSYAIYCSADPDLTTTARIGTSPGSTFVHVGGQTTSAPCYYRVRAVNSCGWEGP